ncbi:MAG: CPBP family intramembrane metalloprotease [Butyrivibrio sp.]|nr:CPBP family intramembrane metalloprotease [Butyrivibrio sp.]
MKRRSSAPGLVLFIIMLLISTVGLALLGEGNFGLPGMIARFVIGIVGVVFMAYIYGVNFKIKGFFKGLFSVAGLVGVVCCIHNLIAMRTPTDIGFKEGLPSAIVMFLLMMAVGVFEEAIYRGVLFNTLRNCFGESKGRIILAVFLSAIPFGLTHFLNLLVYPNLVVWTTSQVVYATAGGVLFACIYYITDNFWLVVVLHGIYDFVASVWSCFASQAEGIGFPTADSTIMQGIKDAIPDTIFGVIALILLIAVLNKREIKRRSIDRRYYA